MDVHGTTTPRFAGVADAFARNFAEGREVGAAVAVHVDGELVVDLWAGTADPATGREWTADTLQCVFSSSKAIVGLAIAMLVDRGVVDYDEPIATYWPSSRNTARKPSRCATCCATGPASPSSTSR